MAQISNVTHAGTPAIGRSKNASMLPSALISEVTISALASPTHQTGSWCIGNRWLPRNPMSHAISRRPNTELLMAKRPKSRTAGFRHQHLPARAGRSCDLDEAHPVAVGAGSQQEDDEPACRLHVLEKIVAGVETVSRYPDDDRVNRVTVDADQRRIQAPASAACSRPRFEILPLVPANFSGVSRIARPSVRNPTRQCQPPRPAARRSRCNALPQRGDRYLLITPPGRGRPS